jgi:hypothetical protein
MRALNGILGAVILLTSIDASRADCALCCPPSQPTFREQIAEAPIVLFGRMENARGTGDGGTTDLVIIDALKTDRLGADLTSQRKVAGKTGRDGNPGVIGQKTVTLPRYIPSPDPKTPLTYLVFGEVRKGKVEFYSGFEGDKRLADYARGIISLDAKKPVEMLRYYIDFLDHPTNEIATDAFRELSRATPEARAGAARSLSPARVIELISKSKHPSQSSVYASLLASCGKPADADTLFRSYDKKTFLDGHYVCLLALKPKEYGPRVTAIARDPETSFLQRYAILSALRQLEQSKSAAFPAAERTRMMEVFLEQKDIADFIIDDFRLQKRWDYTERILALAEKKSHQNPIVQKAILRFALQSPGPGAAAYVMKLRHKDAEWVADTEETLRDDAAP